MKTSINSSDKQTPFVIQLIRFGIIGCCIFGLAYGIFLTALYLVKDSQLAYSISYFLGVCVSFIANKQWTFSENGGKPKQPLLKFVVLTLICYLITLGVMHYFVQILGFSAELTFILAALLVPIINFLGQKFFVFRAHQP